MHPKSTNAVTPHLKPPAGLGSQDAFHPTHQLDFGKAEFFTFRKVFRKADSFGRFACRNVTSIVIEAIINTSALKNFPSPCKLASGARRCAVSPFPARNGPCSCAENNPMVRNAAVGMSGRFHCIGQD